MKKLVALLVGVCLLLFSCVIPEKFTCDINITKTGTYSVNAKSTLVFYTVFDEIKNQGKVSRETDSQIKSYFDDAIKNESAVKKYQYQGNGRAYVEYFKEVNDGSSVDLSSSGFPLTITVNRGGTITVKAPMVDRSSREQLEEYKKYGYNLNGTIRITSELPIIDAGGQKEENKYIFFGPKVIKRVVTFNTLPEQDIIVVIGNR